ncbi:MAG TPA: hypothetical protein VMM92_06505 [Thermoanaerobaculia bacterium]|nr:hypothetical protein [Thermoanaerobaculia bacterium]
MSPAALLRAVHIALGFAALGVGLLPLLSEKGGRLHRRSGLLYLYGLGATALTAALLALRRGDLFLLSLAVLTLYFLSTGRRALAWGLADPEPPADSEAAPLLEEESLPEAGDFQPLPGRRVGPVDWLLAFLLLGFSAASALWQLARPPALWGAMTIVGVVFGVLGSANAVRDLRLLRRLSQGARAGIFEHLMRMIASYIAAATAFSVTNLAFLPPVVRWLWPTVLGTLLITFFARRLAQAAAAAAEAQAAAEAAALEAASLPGPEAGVILD